MSSEPRVYVQLLRAVSPRGDARKIVSMINGFQKEDKTKSIKLVIV